MTDASLRAKVINSYLVKKPTQTPDWGTMYVIPAIQKAWTEGSHVYGILGIQSTFKASLYNIVTPFLKIKKKGRGKSGNIVHG